MDPYRNIFYFFRGAQPRGGERAVYDRQLEDNTTKALINLFEHDASRELLSAFLAGVSRKDRSLATLAAIARAPLFSLQRRPRLAVAPKRGMILSIAPEGAAAEGATHSINGRPDGWIVDRNGGWVVMLESKLNSRASPEQLAGHAKTSGLESCSIVDLSWEEIYLWMRSVRNGQLRTETQFVLGQWLEYMEMIGMTPFSGFSSDDLDYFIHRDREFRAPLKAKVARFATTVREQLPSSLRNRYQRLYPGNVVDYKPIWIAVQRDDLAEPFRQCNFTLELDVSGVRAHAIMRNGRHDQPQTPIGTFFEFVRTRPNEFLQLLRGLGHDYYLQLFSRTGVNGGRPMPGGDRWNQVCEMRLGTLGMKVSDCVADLMTTIKYPGVRIGTLWPRGSAILQDPKVLTDAAVTALSRLAPALEIVHRSAAAAI